MADEPESLSLELPRLRSPSDEERIELRHIEQIAAICDAGSFSEAARRLRLSQPALSKSISRLEAQLGVCLFERSGGAARATEFGRLVADRGRALLASSDALNREVRQRAGGASGRLRIGVGPATRFKPLPEVMSGLLARFPDLQIEARQDNGLKIMRGVHQGRYDVAFGFSENAEPYGDLIRIKLFDDRLVVVARPGHPATLSNHPLTPAELLRWPMASVGVTAAFATWVGHVGDAEAANASALLCDDMELMQQCLPQGFTLRGTRFVLERALAAGELVEVPVTWESVYHCWMLTTSENWRLPIVKLVAEIARGAPLLD